MNRWDLILLSSLISGVAVQPLPAQTTRTVVVPKWSPVPKTQRWLVGDLIPRPGELPLHVQYGYDVNEFGVGTAMFKSCAVRSTASWDNPAAGAKTTVALSHGPNSTDKFSLKWALNQGSDRTVVFSGTLNWPATRKSQGMQFAGRIPFTRTFLFRKSAGKSLVIDARTTWASTPPLGRRWVYDGAQPDVGSAFFNRLPNCWLKYVSGYMSSVTNGTSVGGKWHYTWYNIPRNASCVASIGFKGVGSKWGAWTLPIDMTPLGAPGCFWAVASEVFLPFMTDASGTGRVPILAIPNNPALAGKKFYEQSACAVPRINPLGIVTFFSVEFLIGSGSTPLAVTILGHNDSPPRSSGHSWRLNRGPFVQFTY